MYENIYVRKKKWEKNFIFGSFFIMYWLRSLCKGLVKRRVTYLPRRQSVTVDLQALSRGDMMSWSLSLKRGYAISPDTNVGTLFLFWKKRMIYVFSITKPRFTYTVVSYCFITKPNYKQVFKNNENTVGYYAVLPPGPRGSASIRRSAWPRTPAPRSSRWCVAAA